MLTTAYSVCSREKLIIKNQLSRLFSAKKNGLSGKPFPSDVKSDYIGPPDKQSNLRPFVRCIPENETPLAKELRERQIEVEDWNHDFWSRHNQRYYDEKKLFIQLHQMTENDLSSDKMSEFYKSFLDKNRKLHLLYNISWYLKNFDLLLLSTRVNLQKAWRKIRNRSN